MAKNSIKFLESFDNQIMYTFMTVVLQLVSIAYIFGMGFSFTFSIGLNVVASLLI